MHLSRGHLVSCQGFVTLSAIGDSRYTGHVDGRQAIGRMAEDVAARFLERAGLRVVERNARSALGEIDLVCRDGDAWVFVEVKCRQARWGDAPAAAVSWIKRRRLIRLAQAYLRWRGGPTARCRFDVVAVTVDGERVLEVRHLPAAFDASEA
jgi:putative endonuclease